MGSRNEGAGSTETAGNEASGDEASLNAANSIDYATALAGWRCGAVSNPRCWSYCNAATENALWDADWDLVFPMGYPLGHQVIG